MNRLTAVITAVAQVDCLFALDVDAQTIPLRLLLFDLKPTFAVGSPVHVLCKESEVSLGINLSGALSIGNCFPARVTAITRGQILAEVTVHCRAGELASMLTTDAATRMGLTVGCDVMVLIKESQISLEAIDEH